MSEVPVAPVRPVRESDGSASPMTLPTVEPRIVLVWLARLRWFAVAGQLVAILVAIYALGLTPPLVPVFGVIVLTIATNIVVVWRARGEGTAPGWLVPVVLMLDVLLLTVLLYFTGGPANPFAVLYVVHVAMAVAVLGPGWTWATVLLAALCFGGLLMWNIPLVPEGRLDERHERFGDWIALVLVAALIAYFIGRMTAALRQRERQLQQMRDQAAVNERLASLTTLAAGAAHELGTPLGTIAIVSKELEIELKKLNDPNLGEDAQLIRQEVERCRQIIDRMRGDVAEQGRGMTGICDLADTADDVRESLRHDRPSLLDVSIPARLQVAASSRAVEQSIRFLVNNAFDASPPTSRVKLTAERTNGMVAIRVIDQGSGMDAETLRRATEPFFTTKEPGRGMGLGLFLVRLVADRHGGTFTLDSEPGKGTTATLTLPAA